MAGVPTGAQQLHIRISDKAGNWSSTATGSVFVNPVPVLTDHFDALDPAWSKTVGSVGTVGVVAGQLQVTYPATNVARQPAYVSRNLGLTTPLTTAHVHLDVFASALATGGATPTIFVATSASGATVFAIELRTQGTVKQVRADIGVAGGGVRNGAWVTLPAGATVDLTWQAGRRVGASPGSLLMSFNGGAPVSTITANSSTLSVAGVRLGLVAGQTPAVRGTLSLDNLVVSP